MDRDEYMSTRRRKRVNFRRVKRVNFRRAKRGSDHTDNNLQMHKISLAGPRCGQIFVDGATFRSAVLIKTVEGPSSCTPGTPPKIAQKSWKNRLHFLWLSQVAIVPVTSPLRFSPGVSKLDQPQQGWSHGHSDLQHS